MRIPRQNGSMLPAVQVLLSMRDGADHLPDQLASLVAQMGVDLDLLVRDDGSQDSSVAVLASFVDRLRIQASSDATPLGVPGTYLRLLGQASLDREYWAFCDQDDVWSADKLATAAAALTAPESRSVPTLWVCAAEAFDDHGAIPVPGRTSQPSLGNALVESIGPGCCMVWNEALMRRLVVPPQDAAVLHDSWLYASASILGRVVVEPRVLVRYRVHEHNAIGIDTRLGTRIGRHRRAAVTGEPTWEALAAQLLTAYGPSLPPDQRRVITAMAYGDRRERLRAWLRRDLRRSSALDNLLLLGRLMWLTRTSVATTPAPV